MLYSFFFSFSLGLKCRRVLIFHLVDDERTDIEIVSSVFTVTTVATVAKFSSSKAFTIKLQAFTFGTIAVNFLVSYLFHEFIFINNISFPVKFEINTNLNKLNTFALSY